jgi:hypothetical protein
MAVDCATRCTARGTRMAGHQMMHRCASPICHLRAVVQIILASASACAPRTTHQCRAHEAMSAADTAGTTAPTTHTRSLPRQREP